MATAGLERRGLSALRGPLAVVRGVPGAAYREHVEIDAGDGTSRVGRVVAVSDTTAVVEILGDTEGLRLPRCRVRFRGRPLEAGVGLELLGRVLDGLGRPRDGLPPPVVEEERLIDGAPLNPCHREYPRDFLQTGISAIDGLNTLVLGQKLPIFTQVGLPHDPLVQQILRQARAPGVEAFAVVFVALGLSRETALAYQEAFRRAARLSRLVAFVNLADDPVAERLIAPRLALTAAEYLAFDLGWHVLVVLHDLTNYAEALRELAAASGDVAGRKGYPGYLYSDLASLFERAGRIRGRPGSLTQMPVLTVPAGDLTHPVPDLTGYVTEGQIVLDRELDRRGIYPPIAALPSLSRLMSDGIGPGRTRDDHEAVARQLYAAVARSARARALESIVGTDDLSEIERLYLHVGERYERDFLAQRPDEARSIDETLDRAWAVLAHLPASELTRIPATLLERRRPPGDAPARPPQ